MAIVTMIAAGCGPNRVSKAEELMDAGSLEEAVKLIQEEITDSPKNAEAYVLYGRILIKKEDRTGAYEKFRSAIKVGGDSQKEKIKDLLLGEKDCFYSDFNFINEILPDLVKTDKDFCFNYYVLKPLDADRSAMFAENFPNDPRAPAAIERQASCCYSDGDTSSAKHFYLRLVEKYPKSDEGKAAKRRLADWWTKYNRYIPLDDLWHGFSIRKGQQYRYTIPGCIEYDHGSWGIERVDYKQVRVFVGTEQELKLADSGGIDYTGPRVANAESYCSGVAPRSGMIWFTVNTGERVLRERLKVELEYKE